MEPPVLGQFVTSPPDQKPHRPGRTEPHIFDISYSKFRARTLRVILDFYGMEYKSAYTKQRLFSELQKLSRLTFREQRRIKNHVNHGIKLEYAAPRRILRPRKAPEAAPTEGLIECNICFESFTPEKFPKEKVTNACAHATKACLTCLMQHVDTQIQDMAWNLLSCPICPESLDWEAVKKFASGPAFENYDRQSVMHAFEGVPNFTFCLGPNCSSGQIHYGGDDQPIMTCVACSFKTCFTHMMPWHAEKTCAQYDEEQRERLKQERATKKVVEETSKACPNLECGYRITKNGGCDHMTCRQCRHQFCWLCMASYPPIMLHGNLFHLETCRYHSTRLPAYPW